jgi:hypothetical protein
MLGGAILGALIGLVVVIIMNGMRQSAFKKIKNALANERIDYIIPAYHASASRFKKSMKIYDSYGAMYIKGNKVYYQSNSNSLPIEFDIQQSDIVLEPKWRKLNWLSIASVVGNKEYFTSYKMGGFANDSSATIEAYEILKKLKSQQG